MPDDESQSSQPEATPPAAAAAPRKRTRKSPAKRPAAAKSKPKPRTRKAKPKPFAWPAIDLPPHLKTTSGLLVAVILLGAYISLYELKRPTEDEVEYRAMTVAGVPQEAVTNLALDLPNAKFSLSREGAVWRFDDQPLRADVERITRILAAADPIRADRVMTPTPDQPLPPQNYGFEPPAGSITFVTGDKTTTLLFGAPTPVPGQRYAKLPDKPEIFVLPDQLFSDANQTAETYRDPLLVRFDIWSADRFTITGKMPMSLERVNNVWKLIEPVRDTADRTEVNSLLTVLSQAKIYQVVTEAPVDPKDKKKKAPVYGFDKPALEVTLAVQPPRPAPGPDGQMTEPAAQPPVTVLFGAPLAEDAKLIYAKRSDEPSLYAVEAGIVDALSRDPHGLRSKAVMEFFTNMVTKVEVAKAEQSWAAERTDAGWVTAGTSEALDAKQVDTWLSSLADTRLAGFVDDAPKNLKRYGLDPAQVTVSVWTQDREEPQRLLVGSQLENSDNRHAKIEGRDPVVRLPGFITQLLDMDPDDFKTIIPAPVALPPANAGT